MKSFLFKTNKEIREELGKRIKRYRIESEYSQQELSKKTGVSIHSISNIENGYDFNFDSLIRILSFFRLADNINLLVPDVAVNPYDVHKGIKERQRSKRK